MMNMKLATLTIATAILCLIASGFRADAAENRVAKDLNGTHFEFDKASGVLLQLCTAELGCILRSTPERGGLIDLAYPIPAFGPLRLEARRSRAKVIAEKDSVTVIYQRLGASRSHVQMPEGSVSATVTFKAADDGRSVIVQCAVENKSQNAIVQTLCPDLDGLLPIAGFDATEVRFGKDSVRPWRLDSTPPHPGERLEKFYADNDPQDHWYEFPPMSYYESNNLRWIDYGGRQGGLSVFERAFGYKDVPPTLWLRRRRADPDSIRLAWDHRMTIAAGETWKSKEFWLTAHRGGWAKGIEPYRKFVWSVNPPRELPKHLRESIGARHIWMKERAETDPESPYVYFRYKDLPALATEAKDVGLSEIVPWIMFSSYQEPALKANEILGTENELLQSLEQVKQRGMTVSMFVSVQTIRRPFSEKFGATGPEAVRDNWSYHPDYVPIFRPGYGTRVQGSRINNSNPAYREAITKMFRERLNDGVTSWCWDQWNTADAAPGQEPGIVSLTRSIRQMARAKDPDSTWSAESMNTGLSLEIMSPLVDYTWNWVSAASVAPIENVLRTPRLNAVVDEPLEAMKAFAGGQFLMVSPRHDGFANGSAWLRDFPELTATLRQLQARHAQFFPFFDQGHPLGDSVLYSDTAGSVNGYQLDRKKLLLIVINDTKLPLQASLISDLSLWLDKFDRYTVSIYDADGKRLDNVEHSGAMWSYAPKLQPLESRYIVIDSSIAPANGPSHVD